MITYEVKVYSNGTKYWYLNDKLHREDGPAIEWAGGDKRWYLDGKELTEAEFNEQMNSVKEYSVADLEKILGHRVKVVK